MTTDFGGQTDKVKTVPLGWFWHADLKRDAIMLRATPQGLELAARLEYGCASRQAWTSAPWWRHGLFYGPSSFWTGGLESGGRSLRELRILAPGEWFLGTFWSRYLAQDPLTYFTPPWLTSDLSRHSPRRSIKIAFGWWRAKGREV